MIKRKEQKTDCWADWHLLSDTNFNIHVAAMATNEDSRRREHVLHLGTIRCVRVRVCVQVVVTQSDYATQVCRV